MCGAPILSLPQVTPTQSRIKDKSHQILQATVLPICFDHEVQSTFLTHEKNSLPGKFQQEMNLNNCDYPSVGNVNTGISRCLDG